MRLGIGKRFFLGFMVLVLVGTVLVTLGFMNIIRLSNLSYRSIALTDAMQTVYELLLDFKDLIMPLNDYLIHGNIMEKETFKIQSEELSDSIARVKNIFLKEGHPELVKIIDASFVQVKITADKIFQIESPVGNMEGAILMENIDALTHKAVEALERYHNEYLDKQLEILKIENSRIIKESTIFFLLFSILGLVLSVILSYLLSQRIRKPLAYLESACRRLSSGNLEEKIELNTRDEFEELSNTFNQMVMDLREHQSAIKKANEELAKWSRILEEKVEERTKELKQAQVQIVQNAKMAAVGQLAGSVAHEINNPLTGVLNNVQLIKMEISDNKEYSIVEFKEILDVVEGSALRCKHIVQSLLDFSRAGKHSYQRVSINDVVGKTFILAEHDIRMDNIKIIKDFTPNLPPLMADSSQLQQVFLDLFNNAKWALKDKPEDAELKVKTFLSLDTKSVAIEISDNGCGIKKENLAHIFEPFFTTKKPGEGTGLGLSICYGIIKEHNGFIEAESEGQDKGATFRIKLPLT